MRIDVDAPQIVAIPGIARAAQIRATDDRADGAIAAADLETRQRLKGRTIEFMDARWLVTETRVSAAMTTFASRRIDDV